MANILLAWRNKTDAATLSGGSWLASLPLNNLKNRQVQKVARTTDLLAASTKFVIDLGAADITWGVLALILHNISELGIYRITANTSNSFATPVYDSDWTAVWPNNMVPQGLLAWESPNFWFGTLSAEERAGYQSPLIHIPVSPQTLRYIQVEIQDPLNPAGYLHFGRLFISPTWSPTYNYAFGSSLGYQDPTVIERALSGAEYFEEKSKHREFTFDFSYLSEEEAYNYVLDLQRVAGISSEVLAVPDSEDAVNLVKRSFVGRMEAPPQIKHDNINFFSASVRLKELL